jgi:hypothetical protein
MTGVGPVAVRCPRVRDRVEGGERIRFSSAILPPYARRSKSLESIDFVRKESCRAIQVADLFSFYSRRYGAALEAVSIHERDKISPVAMVNIMTERIPHRSYVDTDFVPSAAGSRFFAGDLS